MAIRDRITPEALFPATGAARSDAELIRLCEEVNASERRSYAAWKAGTGDDNDYPDAEEEQASWIERIAELPPTTLEGAVALAACLLLWTAGDFADGDNPHDILARTLVYGLARLSPNAGELRFKRFAQQEAAASTAE